LRSYPDQALARSQEAIVLARRLSHPHSEAVALESAALMQCWRGEWQDAQQLAETLRALSRTQGFPHWLAVGIVRRGKTLAAQGQVEEGLVRMREGLAALQATGAQLGLPGFFAELAWAQGQAGRAAEGLALLAEALAIIGKIGERVSEAELYRLKGEFLLQAPIRSPKPKGHLLPQIQHRKEAEGERHEYRRTTH